MKWLKLIGMCLGLLGAAVAVLLLATGSPRLPSARQGGTDDEPVTIVISGTLIYPDGSPAADVAVWSSAYGAGDESGRWIPKVQEVRTGQDGTFRLHSSGRPGNFGVHARVSGFEAVDRSFQEVPATDHTAILLALTPLPTVRGRITVPGGGPQNALVRVARRAPSERGGAAKWGPPVHTSATGEYQLTLSPGLWEEAGFVAIDDEEFVICAEMPGLAPKLSAPFQVSRSERARVIDIRLDDGYELTGLVVEQGTGAPVPSALVTVRTTPAADTVWPPAAGPELEHGISQPTDVHGQYNIVGLPQASYSVEVSAANFVTRSQIVHIPTEHPARFDLVPAHPISGRVTGPGGVPVAGASIVVRPAAADDDPRRVETTTTADGRFTVLAAGQQEYLVVVAATGAGPSLAPARVHASAGNELAIELVPGAIITGVLLDNWGTPVRGARCSARAGDGDPDTYVRAVTDTAGRFAMRHLPPGAFTVVFPDYGLAFEGVRTDAVAELRSPGNLSSVGRLVAADGSPVSSNIVDWFEARRVPADPLPRAVHLSGPRKGGSFEFRHLAPGRYEARVSPVWVQRMSQGREDRDVLPKGTVFTAGESLGTIIAVSLRDYQR